jgi:hypothetical protein
MTRSRIYLSAEGNGQSKDYEKSTRPQKPRVDNWSFAGSDSKPVAHQRAVGLSLRAGRFGGRASRDTTAMHKTETSTVAPSDELLRLSRLSWGVLPHPPLRRDTLFNSVSARERQIHSKKTEVSRLSWVIHKTIAGMGVGVCVRPKSGFSKQVGQAGHLRKVTMLTGGRDAVPSDKGVPAKTNPAGTPPRPARTRRRWSA